MSPCWVAGCPAAQPAVCEGLQRVFTASVSLAAKKKLSKAVMEGLEQREAWV